LEVEAVLIKTGVRNKDVLKATAVRQFIFDWLMLRHQLLNNNNNNNYYEELTESLRNSML